jgi:hypothetical protein
VKDEERLPGVSDIEHEVTRIFSEAVEAIIRVFLIFLIMAVITAPFVVAIWLMP